MIGAARDPRSGPEGELEATSPTAFGKYQLFASLGRGGMAEVFLSVARGQMGFNKLAVLKRLRPALAEEVAFRTMFLDEARLAARLNHPNIVHTYEVGEQGGSYFIAMEYLEGQALNKVVRELLRRKEGLPQEIAARIIADALAGLGHAHELRDYDGTPLSIIHRDVSPHNLFVTYDGHTKVVDFGIAKAAMSSTETEVGVLKGKVAYMSPEQAMGARIDARSDLFAMGIVLWELLAQGPRLMTGESAANTLHKLMNEPIPRVSHVLPTVDPGLDAICARALEKDVNRRFQSAAEMRDALERWLAAQHRSARQEDVGRVMLHLFGAVREEVQRQVQRQMAIIASAPAEQTLTAESIRRLEQQAGNGQLLHLGGSGSGSGVISGYGMGSGASQQYGSLGAYGPPHTQSPAPPPSRTNPLLVILAVGFFVLAALLIVLFGLREFNRDKGVAIGGTGPGTDPTPNAGVSGVPLTADPPPIVTVTPTASATAVASAHPTSAAPSGAAGGKHAGGKATPVASAKPSSTAPATTPPASDAPNGFLSINTTPWATVSEGGKVICTTPCFKKQLPPGSHTLTLENPDENLRQTTTVVITSGELTTRSLALK